MVFLDISLRNEYLYNKHLVHYNWRFNMPYQNIRFKKQSGKIAFHLFICTDSHPFISKLIKWNFKPNSRNNFCSICNQNHAYLQKRLVFFSHNRQLLRNLPTQSIDIHNRLVNTTIQYHMYLCYLMAIHYLVMHHCPRTILVLVFVWFHHIH
eukprot:NODE_120_length_17920_cov_0.559782.p11 type:complete len:152 gc:universal NODE_120_length_17920_cov_0.559782:15911-16366(+)